MSDANERDLEDPVTALAALWASLDGGAPNPAPWVWLPRSPHILAAPGTGPTGGDVDQRSTIFMLSGPARRVLRPSHALLLEQAPRLLDAVLSALHQLTYEDGDPWTAQCDLLECVAEIVARGQEMLAVPDVMAEARRLRAEAREAK